MGSFGVSLGRLSAEADLVHSTGHEVKPDRIERKRLPVASEITVGIFCPRPGPRRAGPESGVR